MLITLNHALPAILSVSGHEGFYLLEGVVVEFQCLSNGDLWAGATQDSVALWGSLTLAEKKRQRKVKACKTPQ